MSNKEVIKAKDLSWLGLEAPRYTSYPSAHHFSARTGMAQHEQWLKELGNDTALSVYIHIPFCRELCWFCGCHTKMTRRYEPVVTYVQLLLKEIDILKRHMACRGKLVNIHFGGGSPGLLEPKDMLSVLEAIASAFGISSPGELAIELDPRTTTPENIALYASLGFNRISIGIQDFDPMVQQAINRVQSYPLVGALVGQLRQAGLNQINFDLIYGLPQQTAHRFGDTLEKTVALNPDRIALFSYAHMPQLKKHQRMIDATWLPTEREKLSLYSLACLILESNGYIAIGIDHFAKPDDPLALAMRERTLRRNFQGYVTDGTQAIIGLGSSAISQFPQGYAQSSASAAEYRNRVESGSLATVRGWSFQEDDLIRKHVIDNLMCFMSVDLVETRRIFHLDSQYFQYELEVLKQEPYREIVTLHNDYIRIITPYRMAARAVAAVFDRYTGAAAGRYSKVA